MITDAPIQPYRLLRKFIPRAMQPFIRGFRKRLQNSRNLLTEPYRTVFPFTQVHLVRQENLVRIARRIDESDVPGVIVECGVLDGGTASLMAFASKSSGRQVHLFDSWDGLPETTKEDGDASMWSGDIVGSQRRVISVFKLLDIDLKRVVLYKGWFEDTFPKASIDSVALLHIDGDLYQSVKISLEKWTPLMSKGGYIQIDDYDSFIGCTKAVDEFLTARPNLKLETVEGHFAKAYFIRF
jgi:O-methyltransferase